jgi:hypothetical protein
VGQALATEAIAKCIRSGSVREAESNIELLDLVSTPAAADRDAAFTVKRVKLQESTAKALRRNREFDTTAALKARFKPSTHLAVRLPASHMTLSQADPTGSMTPWRQF